MVEGLKAREILGPDYADPRRARRRRKVLMGRFAEMLAPTGNGPGLAKAVARGLDVVELEILMARISTPCRPRPAAVAP